MTVREHSRHLEQPVQRPVAEGARALVEQRAGGDGWSAEQVGENCSS